MIEQEEERTLVISGKLRGGDALGFETGLQRTVTFHPQPFEILSHPLKASFALQC